ncbi:MAG: mannose-1-phosphate guanylyltransferase [Anaerolineae bacterium]
MYDLDLSDVYVTILAGGSGTRLWPLSRRTRPKQILPLLGERSLLQATVDRVLPLVPAERVHILTGPDQVAGIASQLPGIPSENVFVEPSPRHTGPALGLAAFRLAQRTGGEGVMVSLHADHVVKDEEAFRRAIVASTIVARDGALVTVGIVPTHPETGFGYIERGEMLAREQGIDVYRVTRFTEKPDLERAVAFLSTGRFYWNSGYFTWTLEQILSEFGRQLPALLEQIESVGRFADPTGSEARAVWDRIVPVSIDVGIMEHARHVAVVPAEMGWSDVGSWAAIYDVLDKDSEGNVQVGSGERLDIGSHNTLVHSTLNRMVATVGVDDLVIVDTGDALLILKREHAQDVGRLVERLRAEGRAALL